VSEPRYEQEDPRVRPIVLFGAALAALVALSLLVVGRLDAALERREPERRETHPMSAFRSEPEAPLLQAVPGEELAEWQAEEERLLGTYGWVDRDNDLARIPIERAMAIVAERGLPARGARPQGGGERDER
jgi:hypothetical protein